MNFFIGKNSTLPVLRYPLTQKIREQYNISDTDLKNIGVTFSMVDSNGRYVVANSSGSIKYNTVLEEHIDDEEYVLEYNFELKNTRCVGNFIGQFKIDFLNGSRDGMKITVPSDNVINVIVKDSIVKTSVK